MTREDIRVLTDEKNKGNIMEEILKQEFIDTCIEYGELPLSRATELWLEHRYDFIEDVEIDSLILLRILQRRRASRDTRKGDK